MLTVFLKHNRISIMKRISLPLLTIVAALLFGSVACNDKPPKAAAPLLYHYRATNITPDEPVLLAGFANRAGMSDTVHRKLHSSAVVIKNDSVTTCLIFNDLMEVAPEYIQQIKQRITKETGLPEGNIFIMQSHSHSTPIMDGMGLGWSDANKRYLARAVDSIASNAVAAITNSAAFVPVRFNVGTGECFINTNRRSIDPETGEAVIGKSEAGNCDKTVKALQVTDEGGHVLQTIFNYSCHPVTLGHKSLAVSSDFVGSAEDVVAQHFGGNALFMTGASGDVNPANGLSANAKVADTEGAKLGDAVNIAKFAADSNGNFLKTFNLHVQLPYRDTAITAAFIDEQVAIKSAQKTEFVHWKKDVEAWGDIMKQRLVANKSLPAARNMQLGGIRVGNTIVVFTQGEFFNSYQTNLRKKFPGVDILFAGYTNGEAGYVPDGAAFALKGYEVDQAYIYLREPSPLTAKTESILTEALERIVNNLL